jgi:hypothetical protein
MNVLIIGTEGDPRVSGFNAALASYGLPPAQLITYADLLAGHVDLADHLAKDMIIRIESPGRDLNTCRGLLHAGAVAAAREGYRSLPPDDIDRYPIDRGGLLPFRQWYLGFRCVLDRIEAGLEGIPPRRVMNPPRAIAELFDKVAMHKRLQQAGVPVPRSLPPITGYDDLRQAMRVHRLERVFIKPAHGSSGAGMVALQVARPYIRAITTVELVEGPDQAWAAFNTRQIRTLRRESDVARLVDYLGHDRLHIEAWLPKAGFDDHTFDLRIVVIGGQARHSVMRLSKHPITNLHLLNRRLDVSLLVEHIGDKRWHDIQKAAVAAAACYPDCLYVGVDLAVNHNYERPTVLEVNAFGDLLNNVHDCGLSTYTAEVQQCLMPTT